MITPDYAKFITSVPLFIPDFEIIKNNINVGQALQEHGGGLFDTWTGLAYQEPPKDLFGRIFWSLGVLGQLVISFFTFPAALGAFLLEEAVQTAGMGAYMLASTKDYESLANYMPAYKNMIDGAETGAKTLATINPITGGAVIIYMQAARMSMGAFATMTATQLQKKAETDEKLRNQILEDAKYGSINIKSLPTGTKIFLDGVDTETETPETFKKLEAGSHSIKLIKEKPATGERWEYTFTATIAAGKKKELTIHVPQTQPKTTEKGSVEETPETPKLPDFIKAEVTGSYAIDGDTFVTTTGEKVRLLGIDAPELGRPYADLAKTMLESKTADKKVELSIQTHLPIDAYGRTLAMCAYRDENLSVALVAAGLARAFIADDARYDPKRILAAEQLAKERRIGIWSEIP
jgi:endonuclease YncB( thermonuclease family)